MSRSNRQPIVLHRELFSVSQAAYPLASDALTSTLLTTLTAKADLITTLPQYDATLVQCCAYCTVHLQILSNGVECRLQRNALAVLEAPTGNETVSALLGMLLKLL